MHRNVGRKTVQLPEWNVGQQQLFININMLRQLGIYNRAASEVRQEGWPGLINKELFKKTTKGKT